MSSAVPTTCAACGGDMHGTVFYERGKAYHFGCRPSQQTNVLGLAVRQEHTDLLVRIAQLEAALAALTEKSRNWGTMMHELMSEKEAAEAALAAEREMAERLFDYILFERTRQGLSDIDVVWGLAEVLDVGDSPLPDWAIDGLTAASLRREDTHSAPEDSETDRERRLSAKFGVPFYGNPSPTPEDEA